MMNNALAAAFAQWKACAAAQQAKKTLLKRAVHRYRAVRMLTPLGAVKMSALPPAPLCMYHVPERLIMVRALFVQDIETSY
jgi:hypothetical protein